MVFSLFGRKDKTDAKRARAGSSIRIAESSLRASVSMPGVEAQRELARRTTEKIDRIESEMIDSPASIARAEPTTQPAGRTLVAHPQRLVPSQAQLAPVSQPELAPLEFEQLDASQRASASRPSGGIEVIASALPPDLEEAAILYANGQAAAAAATLRAGVTRGGTDSVSQQAWRMLFDVLQALDARSEFEAIALEYAACFEKSPPGWQSRPLQPAPRRALAPVTIVLPACLDVLVQAQFEIAQRSAINGRPVIFDFSAVRSVDPQGAALAATSIGAFETAGRELTVAGARELFTAAQAAIETGRRDPGDACWQLCLLSLRLLGERSAFDDLSIDFCVTYEVSPPPWESLATSVRLASTADPAPTGTLQPSEQPAGANPDGNAFALRGEITGRMVTELEALRAWIGDREEVRIDCRALQRLNFVAAGELLNEAAGLLGAGRRIVFIEPSAIVEALMIVMGLHELADIRRRKI